MNIVLVHCPSCKDKWIREDTDIVCEDCESKVALDVELDQLIISVDNLHSFSPVTLSQRKVVLQRILGKVNFHIERIKSYKKSLSKEEDDEL